ncbi:hypothetical protein IGB42_02675 [Andreprevotia sp. IGB-42]|uniref:DUF3426 domain-containing protein n=1 Tax=Andreprevotia sp. IGB-42 TaxID=2497473 RepID=UPI00157F64D2|nr:DUF3426 domain-containing protein [Andreprevotia sp. IGB-42]KAF0812832.1 hypothetical protein IGB42_02675 [Andreprevotia sp. IGB-42]
MATTSVEMATAHDPVETPVAVSEHAAIASTSSVTAPLPAAVPQNLAAREEKPVLATAAEVIENDGDVVEFDLEPDVEPEAAAQTATDMASTAAPAADAEEDDDETLDASPVSRWPDDGSDERPPRYQPIRSLEDEALLTPPPPRSLWRWAWVPLIALALAALLLQLAYVYRTEFSTQLPWLRTHYQRVCTAAGCSLPLPTHAELLRSDYSELTFVPGHDRMIQLTASVRNLAPYDQALPMLELTLTDEREQVVAKKVFTARDYLVPTERGRTQFPAGDEVHAFLQLDLGELRSTGYSLFWYYP